MRLSLFWLLLLLLPVLTPAPPVVFAPLRCPDLLPPCLALVGDPVALAVLGLAVLAPVSRGLLPGSVMALYLVGLALHNPPALVVGPDLQILPRAVGCTGECNYCTGTTGSDLCAVETDSVSNGKSAHSERYLLWRGWWSASPLLLQLPNPALEVILSDL